MAFFNSFLDSFDVDIENLEKPQVKRTVAPRILSQCVHLVKADVITG